MDLDFLRKSILKEIIELYRNSDVFDKLLQLIERNENIAYLLKVYAIMYHFLMTTNKLVWSGEHASFEYEDYMLKYQKCYQLYIDFVHYFLGANITYPSLDYQIDSSLKEFSLITSEGINYQSFFDVKDDILSKN